LLHGIFKNQAGGVFNQIIRKGMKRLEAINIK
jgi:hypothetical protein